MERPAETSDMSFGGEQAAFTLFPRHREWLKEQRKKQGRSQSLILRDLIDKAMEEGEAKAEADT